MYFDKALDINPKNIAAITGKIIKVTSCASPAALYGLDWYKNRKQNRRLARKVEEEEYHNAKEPLAEQLAYMESITINNSQTSLVAYDMIIISLMQ